MNGRIIMTHTALYLLKEQQSMVLFKDVDFIWQHSEIDMSWHGYKTVQYTVYHKLVNIETKEKKVKLIKSQKPVTYFIGFSNAWFIFRQWWLIKSVKIDNCLNYFLKLYFDSNFCVDEFFINGLEWSWLI